MPETLETRKPKLETDLREVAQDIVRRAMNGGATAAECVVREGDESNAGPTPPSPSSRNLCSAKRARNRSVGVPLRTFGRTRKVTRTRIAHHFRNHCAECGHGEPVDLVGYKYTPCSMQPRTFSTAACPAFDLVTTKGRRWPSEGTGPQSQKASS